MIIVNWRLGRGASHERRSHSGSSGGFHGSENAGISSENCVRIVMAENLRFLVVGSSALGKPEAKARPRGVVDAHGVENPQPSKVLSRLTPENILTRAMVDPGKAGRKPSRGTENSK